MHQTQRSVVPVDDVLFDDQLRLTTTTSTPGRSASALRDPMSSSGSHRYGGGGGTENRLMFHGGSQEHLTAFARPALSTSGSSQAGSSNNNRPATDSPVIHQQTHRKRVGFADSVDEQPANDPDQAKRGASYETQQGNRSNTSASGSASGDTPQRGVSPWRHHKSAIV